MLLKLKGQGVIIKVSDIHTLLDPYAKSIEGRVQSASAQSDKQLFDKSDLCFLSGEPVPQCWHQLSYDETSSSKPK